MSNLHVSRVSRFALAALLVTPVVGLSGCRPRGATAGPPAPGDEAPDADTSSTAIGGGKSIERLFAGRFAGVSVSQTSDGGLQIRIRGGSNSFLAGQEPLYLVDDTPLPTGTGGIVYLNPYDIETIEVLKNPTDIGVYGIRGANGVIRITTIRPGRR